MEADKHKEECAPQECEGCIAIRAELTAAKREWSALARKIERIDDRSTLLREASGPGVHS